MLLLNSMSEIAVLIGFLPLLAGLAKVAYGAGE